MECDSCIAYGNICESGPDGACEKFHEKLEPRLALVREMAKYIKDYLKLLKAVVNKLQVPEAAPLYKDMVAVESLLTRHEEMKGKEVGK